jgi:putative N6-adenine-specific DNA methylase
MDWTKPSTLRITCARGLGPYLRQELADLGFTPEEDTGYETGVEVQGTLLDTQRLNLLLRTPYHVLYHLDTFHCDSGDDLYHGVRELPWEDMISPQEYLSVVSRVNHPSVDNTMWPNLKTKDAIVDRINETMGARPDSGPQRRNVVVTLHWSGRTASIYLDTSGAKLSDRGYRKRPGHAPLRESLAAGIVMATGYDGSGPLVNPMCGSGTLAIEAALIASGRAPGLLRGNYGLKSLLGFDKEAWDALRAELRQAKRGKPGPIVASDHDPKVVEAAQHNAKTAGVDDLIEFKVCDFADTPLPEVEEGGHVLFNPAYGERLGDVQALEETYGRIGDFFKQSCQGYTGWLFTGNRQLIKKVGLRASRKFTFWNGEIECRLVRYLLFKGKHKGAGSE